MKMNIVISTLLKLTHEIKDWFFFFFFFTSDRSIMTHTQLNESLHCSGPASGTEHLSMPVNEIHDCGKKKERKRKEK